MSESHTNKEDLLKLLLSLIPNDDENLQQRAILLASFDNLKEAVTELEDFVLKSTEAGIDAHPEKELLEELKKELN